MAELSPSRGHEEFHTQCHKDFEAVKNKMQAFFFSGPPLSARPQIFCACTLPCNYHCYYSALLLFDGVDGTQPATCGATGQEKRG